MFSGTRTTSKIQGLKSYKSSKIMKENIASINLYFRDHPLLELKNVILTPHIGSATHQARRQIMENLVESILEP